MLGNKLSKNTFASLAAVLTTLTPAAFAHDASADFSFSSNPNGVWKYGFEYPSGTFNLINSGTAGKVNSNPDVWFWQGGSGFIGEPTVGKNVGTTAWTPGGTTGTTTYQPGDFGLHPGPFGERAVVRWTALTNGTYQVTASFKGGDSSTTSDAKIVKAGTQLWSANVSGNSTPQTYNNSVTVTAGQVIDFSVGWGSNGDYYFDTTITTISICPVP